MQISWIKSQADNWLVLNTFNLSGVGNDTGVYIIWHGGNPSRVVRVGQGNIAERLGAHRVDAKVQAYARHTLYVTWAVVAAHLMDGIERHLADTWNPLVGDAFPNAVPIAVNSPWG